MKGRSGQTLSAVGFSALVALAGTKQERWILICPASDEDEKKKGRAPWQPWEGAESAPPYPETIPELVLDTGWAEHLCPGEVLQQPQQMERARGEEICHWECAVLLFVLTV